MLEDFVILMGSRVIAEDLGIKTKDSQKRTDNGR